MFLPQAMYSPLQNAGRVSSTFKWVHTIAILCVIVLTSGASPTLYAQSYKVIYHFPYDYEPNGLTRDAAGNFFGTTLRGGSFTQGTVFKLDSTHNVSFIYDFGSPYDGEYPYDRVTLDSGSNLYGTTRAGGVNGLGTVFKIDPEGVETILHSFNESDGATPTAGLTRDPAGNLYGTTELGGVQDNGVVFRINPSGKEETLYQFLGPDGSQPSGGLARDSAGNLYGTTKKGGDYEKGTVFKLAPDGTEVVLHSFARGADGGIPFAEPILDSSGNLYGTTDAGGDFNLGSIFKIDSSGTFAVLHSFNGADGQGPISGLVLDAAGNVYGDTVRGGDFQRGVLFKIDPSGDETVLHSFTGGADGSNPNSTLLWGSDGTIFGTTPLDGFHDGGTIFRLKP